MRFSGHWYEAEGMDDPLYDLQDAIVTEERIAMDWEEYGYELHAVLHSKDGGYYYKGMFGEPLLDPNYVMEAWRYRSLAGDEILWIKWNHMDNGGTGFVHLSSNEDET